MDFAIGELTIDLGIFSGYVEAVLILAVTFVMMKVSLSVLGAVRKRTMGEKGNKGLNVIVLNSMRLPAALGVLLFGVFLALKALPGAQALAAEMDAVFTVVMSFYLAFFASKVIGIVIDWYMLEIAHKTKTKADDQFLPILKRAAYGIVFGIVIIAMLNQLGIRVETLIATLGIGGLAVALALQPTLSNFFSGLQMVADRPLRIGDYVEIESGDRGTVVDIGWRSTSIKTYMNNIVAIPNSKLSDSRIINYSTPSPEIGFSVECGVAYDSDLEKVERVSLEVARKVMERCEGVKSFEPLFRYREFGASSINFKVVMRTRTIGSSYLATHDFIKSLKSRFDSEGITISFPQLDVHFDRDGAAPSRDLKRKRAAQPKSRKKRARKR
jgi:small-conductance mechanosensitive channel